MAPIVRGSEAACRVKTASGIEQATGATLWQSLNFYSETFQPGQSIVNDDELGGSRDNGIDPVQGALGLANPQGSMQVPLDRNQIAFWLNMMWGAPTTVGASAPYTHTWKSGVAAPQLKHIELPYGAAFVKMADSQAVKTMSINLADEDGFKKADLTFVGRSVRNLASAISSSPTAAPARDKIKGTAGLIKINGTNFGNVLGGTMNIDNGAFFERYLDDSDWPGAVEMGMPSMSCTPEIRIRTDALTMLNTFDGATPFTFELLYQLSVSVSLSFKSDNVIAPPVSPNPSGAGPMSVTPQFQMSQKVTATTKPMLTVALINSTASYA